MSSPEVSVVMSVYNGVKYLHESLESILLQEGVDFEFIIVNDGSTDDSGNILAEYAARDDRIRIIDQENAGLTCALIRGCEEAKGKYIARQDADDLSHSDRLSKQLKLIRSDPKILLVSCSTKFIGPDNEMLAEVIRPANPDEATQGLIYNKMGPPAHGSVMFRKNAYHRIGGYRQEFYYGQDSDLWLRLSQYGQIAYFQDFLYSFRLHPHSIAGTRRDLQKQFGEIGQACHSCRLQGKKDDKLLEMASTLRNHIIAGKTIIKRRRNTAAINYLIGSCLQKMGDRNSAKYLWNTIKITPYHLKAWVRLANSVFFSSKKT